MPAAVIMLRVSTTKQQQRNELNLPAQEKKCQDWAASQKITVLKVFTGKGESAWKTERPTLEEALEYIKQSKGRVTHFIVQDLSRFARNDYMQAAANARLKKMGVNLVSVDEPMIDDSPVGKLTTTILSGIAEFHSHSLSSRVRYRFQVNREQGRWLHIAPIGYLNQNKKLVLDPDKAPLVRQSFELVATGSYTSDHVMKLIAAAGLRTKSGRKLCKQSFSDMLKKPLYCGVIVHKGKKYKGNFEPLVSEELWQRTQDVLTGKRKSVPRNVGNELYPLRGFVRCANCGDKMTAGAPRGRSGKTFPSYWCWNRDCTDRVKVSVEQIESDWLALLSVMEPTADALVNVIPKMAGAKWQQRVDRIAHERQKLSQRMADQKTLNLKLVTAKLNGELSPCDFDDMKKALADEVASIEDAQRALTSESATMEQLIADTERQLVDLVGAWKKGGLSERQEVQSALFPNGLLYSQEKRFFEPGNTTIQEDLLAAILELADVHGTSVPQISGSGGPGWT